MSENEKTTVAEETIAAPAAGQFDAAEVEANKLNGILSYLDILVLVPFFQKAHEKSEYVKFHMNQGILLTIATIAGSFVFGLLSAIFTAIVPVIGLIFSALSGLWGLACFVLLIIGVLNAVKGAKKKLPVIGELFTVLK